MVNEDSNENPRLSLRGLEIHVKNISFKFDKNSLVVWIIFVQYKFYNNKREFRTISISIITQSFDQINFMKFQSLRNASLEIHNIMNEAAHCFTDFFKN